MILPAPDYFAYKGEIHRIYNFSSREVSFDPSQVGMKTHYHSTANAWGYVAIYAQIGNKIYLLSLCENPKVTNGFIPVTHQEGIFLEY